MLNFFEKCLEHTCLILLISSPWILWILHGALVIFGANFLYFFGVLHHISSLGSPNRIYQSQFYTWSQDELVNSLLVSMSYIYVSWIHDPKMNWSSLSYNIFHTTPNIIISFISIVNKTLNQTTTKRSRSAT